MGAMYLVRSVLAVCVALSLASSLSAALMLTNFSPSVPLQLMPVGDSITDDCFGNGAWRLPIQPVLEAAGVPYETVGRAVSTFALGFTQREHEGYCGAVIAPPGSGGPAHGYPGLEKYLQRIVPDALTNATPDLLFLLIGGNDIGRGRNPWTVATNDLAVLLDGIFSEVPDVHVMVGKITTLEGVTTSGYGNYATNVPIYNAAVQTLVNQRRDAGQNLFLADMFSAVDPETMFQADQLHPNALGQAAIAAEWAARVETILVRTNRRTDVLIRGGAEWAYWDAGGSPGADWAQPGFDANNWSRGLARLGYGEPAVATGVGYGADSTNKNVTTYFRHEFVVPEDAAYTNLNFRVARADGVAVWLNGTELFRTNLPAGELSPTNRALQRMTGFTPHIFYPTNIPVPPLPAGTNVVAAEVHLSSPTNQVMGFDLELLGTGYPVVIPPQLFISLAGAAVALSWAEAAGSDYLLQTNANLTLTNAWGDLMAPRFTNSGQISVTQALAPKPVFFRLRQP
jgi:lysophospholipase L1-like esterase